MLSLEQARTRILDRMPRLPMERVPLLEGLDRFAAEDIRALRPVPGFDNSAFDGYAVHSSDVASASPEHPVTLRVAGLSSAGSVPGPAFPNGSCVRIFTGAPLPAGADAIVMQEDTRRPTNPEVAGRPRSPSAPPPEVGGRARSPSAPPRHVDLQCGVPGEAALPSPTASEGTDRCPGADTDLVEILTACSPWEGVRFAGEDVRPGDVLVRTGHKLRPGALSLVASTGVNTLPVHRRPRLWLLSTGSELIEPGQPLQPGQIHDSNGVLLESLARREGVELVGRKRIADDLEATLEALDQAAQCADVVITTGGVSVGDADLLRPALARLGGEVDLWRIAMKPGKPFAFGRLRSAWWFGLPGNPVSAFVTWRVLVRPALHRLMGSVEPAAVALPARLGQPFTNRGDRRHLIRATLDTQGRVFQSGTQGSHLQAGLAHANVLLDLPASTTWEAGREVTVELLD